MRFPPRSLDVKYPYVLSCGSLRVQSERLSKLWSPLNRESLLGKKAASSYSRVVVFIKKVRRTILGMGAKCRAFLQYEPARAVRADDFVGAAHFQIDLWMPQSAATAIASNVPLLDFDKFGGGHGQASFMGDRELYE